MFRAVSIRLALRPHRPRLAWVRAREDRQDVWSPRAESRPLSSMPGSSRPCSGPSYSSATPLFTRAEMVTWRKAFMSSESLLRSHLRAVSSCQALFSPRRPESHRPPHNQDKSSPSPPPPGGDGDKERTLEVIKLLGFFVFLLFAMRFFGGNPPQRDDPEGGGETSRIRHVSWNDFLSEMLMKGEVDEILVHVGTKHAATVILRPDAVYKGKRVRFIKYRLNAPNIDNLEDQIREIEEKLGIKPGDGVSISYERRTQNTASALARGLFLVAFAAFLMMSLRFIRKNVSTGNPFQKFTKAAFTLIDPQIKSGKGVKFSDVAGLKEAKIEVKEFVDYLKNPQKYKELGAKPPKGAMLFGPPGCGKTMLAKAVANESNVPFLQMNGSEFMERLGGLGAARVRSLFEEARKRAPSIIYIDEIDAIGRQRGAGAGGGGGGNDEQDQTLNQLLVEMDGILSKEGVIMLASTNRSDILDRALLRPGRFDRHIEIALPTLIERKEILEQHMKGVSLSDGASGSVERLATLTPGFSGADLANVINEAALHAAREKGDSVGKEDFEYAIERVIAGPKKKTSVLNPVERRVVAYHESGHALVGWLLPHTDALLKVTILPRTTKALGFAQYTPRDKKLYSPEELLDQMCMALGGRAAEAITFNRVTTGAQNDLEKVTRMAYAQVKQFGFNESIGPVSFDPSEEEETGLKPYSKKLQATMDLEARKLVSEAYQRTEELLKDNSKALAKMSEALLERETLNYDDVVALLGPPTSSPSAEGGRKKGMVTPEDFERQMEEQAAEGRDPTPTKRKTHPQGGEN